MQRIEGAVGEGASLYVVGRDRAGCWLAMDARGCGGGMFASREAAMRFARVETAWRTGAVSERTNPIGFASA